MGDMTSKKVKPVFASDNLRRGGIHHSIRLKSTIERGIEENKAGTAIKKAIKVE